MLRKFRPSHGTIAACVALAAAATLSAIPASAYALTSDAQFERASSDGSRVFFSTSDRLVAADTDDFSDVYERAGGTTTLISTGPNGGNGAVPAVFAGASADGSRVFFHTSERLDASADTDSLQDVYERTGGATTLISTGPDGGNGESNAFFTGASADGSRVSFHTGEQLDTSADTDSQQDVYERTGGATTLISTGPDGGNGATSAIFRGMSADGSRVFFTTSERLDTSADTDTQQDVYERTGSATALISTGPNGGNGAIQATFEGASSDGTRVFFRTSEPLVTPADSDSASDIYERMGATTTMISTSPDDGNFAKGAAFNGASTDGSRVFFTTGEQLDAAADTENEQDIYEHAGSATTLISTGPNGGNGAAPAEYRAASADGGRVFFETQEPLVTPADSDSSPDVYERASGATTLISTGPNGGNGAFDALLVGSSADGSRVFFQTDERLDTSADTDSQQDIYEHAGGTTTLISTGPNGGNGAVPALFTGASTDGSRVFFGTSEQLVTPADSDTGPDVYQRSGTTTTLISVAGDTDADGVLDPSDNCALVSNAAQTNTDGDPNGNPCDSDDDNDGVADASDNCSLVKNAAQVNSELREGGDRCDPDDDNDGLPDSALTEAGRARIDRDSDDDGLGDYREVKRTKTRPRRFDTDGDGISDGVERGVTKPIANPPGAARGTKLKRFRKDLAPRTRTKPKKKDTDGDGRSDGAEDKNHNGRRDKGETNPLKRD